jgi:hypothetical protein
MLIEARPYAGRPLMTRPTTEASMSIDGRTGHREGVLSARQCVLHSLAWMWAPTERIAVLTKTAVVLMFRSRSWRGEYGRTITQRVVLTLRKTHSVSVTLTTLF